MVEITTNIVGQGTPLGRERMMWALRDCPSCGQHAGRRIEYGEPDAQLQAAAAHGDIVLGGTVIEADAPAYRCTACGHEWGEAIRI